MMFWCVLVVCYVSASFRGIAEHAGTLHCLVKQSPSQEGFGSIGKFFAEIKVIEIQGGAP